MAAMFFAAGCFILWIYEAFHLAFVMPFPVVLFLGPSQALIAIAAYHLGSDVQRDPRGSKPSPQRYRWPLVLSIHGTFIFIVVLEAFLFSW